MLEKNLKNRIKKISRRNLELLTYDIRDFLISNKNENGASLASNLGAVELAIALHRVFDSDNDKIVWDIGEKIYIHNAITEKTKELTYKDRYGSSSVSVAMGFAEARDILGEDHHVIAVIGDGTLTNGRAYEGLNSAGHKQTRMIVIVNDDETSISENTGSLTQYLSKLRASPAYQSAKHAIRDRMAKIPRVGENMVQGADRMRNLMRFAVVPGSLFEELGWGYYGPVDGHNLGDLIDLFEAAKHLDGPVLIHLLTKKGKGYLNVERYPERSVAASEMGKSAGEAMMELADRDERVVCVCAGPAAESGLDGFAKSYFRHFFDAGLAVEHALTFAAGLAEGGLRPFVFVKGKHMSKTNGRVLYDICEQGLPVVIMVEHDSIGEAGGMLTLNNMPGLALMVPGDPEGLKSAAAEALESEGPVAILYCGSERKAK